MKQNFKRFLSWTLALLMALSLLPAGLLTLPAHAEELPAEREQEQEQTPLRASAKVEIEFKAPETAGGFYNAAGNQIEKGNSSVYVRQDSFEVEAYPGKGYRFVDWYDLTNGKSLSSNAKDTLSFEEKCTVTARFATQDTATFKVDNKTFTGLQAAIDYAQGNGKTKITLASDGSIYGDYTIPAGITLLIPFDAAGTVYTDEPGYIQEGNNYVVPSVFRKLTMEEGASIIVEGKGAISVGGKHYTCSQAQCCKTTGPYGQIQMEAGSSITLKNGAKLYAWGYITGDGQITANSGAEVYEYFQIMDWRGGSCTSDMEGNNKKVFPFSQYYVQNIEAELTIQAGAREKAYLTVYAANGFIIKSVFIDYVGEGGLFSLKGNGTFTKKYDPKNDRIIFKITGDAELSEIQLKIKLSFLSSGINIRSSDYVLPINNNVDMQILSGTTTVSKDAALLPGVTVSIAKGAELKVAEGANLYVYAAEQWNKAYVQGSNDLGISPVAYSPSGKGNRTVSDATIDVNGTLTAAGAIYTTEGGANICSSKRTGVYVQQGQLGKSSETYQCIQNGKTPNYTVIPITPAKLHNGDGSYTPTKDSEAGTTINYVNGVWGGTAECTHTETEVRDAKPATCAQEGYTGDTYCKSCGEKIVTGTTIPKTQNHTWDAGTVTTPATCTDSGVKTFTCSVCNATKTETIQSKGHTEVVDAAVEPTCTVPGKTEGKHCSVCNEVLAAQTEIPAKGHTGGRATCKEKAKCETCGEEYGALDPANHAGTETDWGKTESTHKETYRCCGAVKTEEAAHTFGEWSDGKHTCSICGYEAKCGHNDTNKDHKCDICGKELSVHAFGDWSVTKAAGYVTPGEKTRTCSVCNAAEKEAIPSILQQLQDLRITAAEDGRRTMTLPTGKKVLVLLAGYSQAGQLQSIQVLSANETGEVTFTRPDSEKAMLFFLQEDYKPLHSCKVTQ